MIRYKHTQVGYLMLSVSLALVLFYAWIYQVMSAEADFNYYALAVMVFVLFIIVSFSTLQVIIDESYLRIKFGYGIFRKKFLLSEIISAKRVRSHWYYGWGIRVWFWPYMWIYNVSGLNAVEIIMKDGRTFRIGTDVSSELEIAIKKVI